MKKKSEKNKESVKRRVFWLDVLRILSILAVVTIHVSVQNWDKVAASSDVNIVLATFDGISRFAVPVFVMISGALMLNREIGALKCLTKIGRLAIVWIFWCAFYAVMALVTGKGREAALHDLIFGHFHMWFLPMIAALYLITPVLRYIAKNQRWCVVAIIALLVISVGLRFRWTAYPMYYLLGYVLGCSDIMRGKRRVMTLAMMVSLYVASVVAIVAMNVKASVAAGAAIHPEDADWSTLTVIQSVAVFIGVKYFVKERSREGVEQKICSHFAADILGVYLVHIAVLGLLNRVGVSNIMFGGGASTAFGTMLTIVLTTGISVAIIEVMRRVPGLRRVV